MSNQDPLEHLKFPLGRFDTEQPKTEENRARWKKTIADFPHKLKGVAEQLSDSQLDTHYRPEGWTVRQVIHHLADSHMNAYIRFKWALTEDRPTIKAYDQTPWAELDDARVGDIKPSLDVLTGVHARLSTLLGSMSEDQYNLEILHPEWTQPLSTARLLSLYAWHSEHHLAHITHLADRSSWNLKQ